MVESLNMMPKSDTKITLEKEKNGLSESKIAGGYQEGMCLRGEGACVVVEEVGVKLSGDDTRGREWN